VRWRWSRPHIGEEAREATTPAPAVTDGYSARTVVAERPITRVVAPLHHSDMGDLLWRSSAHCNSILSTEPRRQPFVVARVAPDILSGQARDFFLEIFGYRSAPPTPCLTATRFAEARFRAAMTGISAAVPHVPHYKGQSGDKVLL
jgi:hypothetical protein